MTCNNVSVIDKGCNDIGDCKVGVNDIVLRIFPKTIGGTLVTWDVPSALQLSPTATYQLQFGRTGDNNSSDWENVGPPIVNGSQAYDYRYRDIGAIRHSYYRVLIGDITKTYVSLPHYSDVGDFNNHQRRLYGEIVRREQQRYQDPAQPAAVGYLLKLKRHGFPCTECTDPDTNQRIKEHCDTCFGGGYEKGYYAPVPCFHMDVGTGKVDTKMYENLGMATEGNIVTLRWLNIPQVDPHDIWVDASVDYRWEIGEITTMTRINQLPLICSAIGARLPLNHQAYRIPVTGLGTV